MKLKTKINNKIKGAICTACLAGLVAGYTYLDGIYNISSYFTTGTEATAAVNIDNLDSYTVIRVVDGDTIKVMFEGEEESVRLIGIDTPESVHPDSSKNTEFGEFVSAYAKETLEGKEVVLEFDENQRDMYDRLLAYVYIDGEMFNKTLVEKGYADVSTYKPNVRYEDDFEALALEAKHNKLGMWE